MTSFSPATLDKPAIYRLLTGLVVPRPIAFVSTLSAEGTPNLAPFSFFTVVSVMPPMLGIAVGKRQGISQKDTLTNITATGEFVINVVSEDIAEQMNTASLDWAPEVDEFVVSGLTAVNDTVAVKPPRILESPAQFECRHERSIEFEDYVFVIGKVEHIHVADGLFDAQSRIDPARLRPLGRLAGALYCRTRDIFALERNADNPEKHGPAPSKTPAPG